MRSATAVWRRLSSLKVLWKKRPDRSLRLCETLDLGERRFVAIVQFEQQRFLIGGTSSSMSLLAPLAESRNAVEDRRNQAFVFTSVARKLARLG
jgi:flagellar biogenesis protein FliO